MLWVFIRSASARHFKWIPTTLYFCREIRKLFTWYPLLSRTMIFQAPVVVRVCKLCQLISLHNFHCQCMLVFLSFHLRASGVSGLCVLYINITQIAYLNHHHSRQIQLITKWWYFFPIFFFFFFFFFFKKKKKKMGFWDFMQTVS